MKKVQMDVCSGIYEVRDFESLSVVLPQEKFLGCLKDISEGEILAAVIDDDAADMLDEKYGLKKL